MLTYGACHRKVTFPGTSRNSWQARLSISGTSTPAPQRVYVTQLFISSLADVTATPNVPASDAPATSAPFYLRRFRICRLSCTAETPPTCPLSISTAKFSSQVGTRYSTETELPSNLGSRPFTHSTEPMC